MEKKRSIIKNPKFALGLLSIAIICLIVWAFIPSYQYVEDDDGIVFENPEKISASLDGWNAVVDDRDTIYCINEVKEFVYGIYIDEFNYENAEILDIVFGNDNNLYCHIAVYCDDAYLTETESVWEINREGEIVREVVFYDYRNTDNQPSHQVNILGLKFYNERLWYLYEENNGYNIMKIDLSNPQKSDKIFFELDGYARIMKCEDAENGSYIVLKNNGEIGKIDGEGHYSYMYKASYDSRKTEGMFPTDVIVINGDIYMLEGQGKYLLYKWTGNNWQLLFEVTNEVEVEGGNVYKAGLGNYDNKLAVMVNGEIYELSDNEKLVSVANDFRLPAGIKVCIGLSGIMFYIGIIFILPGIVLNIGNIMNWRFSLLSKQIISTIPIVCILLCVVITILFSSMIDLSSTDIIKETIVINEIAASQFDGDELAKITNYESVDNGLVNKLNEQLREFINGNKSDWSRNYNIAIGVRTVGEKYVCIASSDKERGFMTSEISVEAPIHEDFYDGSSTFAADASYGEDRKNLHLVLMTPIYKDDGSYDAVIVMVASQNRLIDELVKAGITLLINVLLWVAVLVLVISLVSAKNVRALRRAKDVIAQIAGGDFSVRVEKYTRDEVGEICVGVNDMAAQLEAYIEELKTNEKFYYKFVPEKFRELLNKEKFTDLALGDAQSEELSILFCDIRAFSMNSEMMTAKESFEFVNKIYGKAGPIIRNNNGFIDKYIGDAVMALFESADDAVKAGIELYKAIVLCENPVEDFGMTSVKIGVGVHTGLARIGIVGEEERMSGTVIADTVNLSSRIESLTKRYGAGMIISKDTLDRMKKPDVISKRYLGMVQVAGVNEVATLYEVLDCLTVDEQTLKEETKTEFKEAIRMFHTGEMQRALDSFRALEKQNPDDMATKLYAKYIEDMIANDMKEYNIFRFKQK